MIRIRSIVVPAFMLAVTAPFITNCSASDVESQADCSASAEGAAFVDAVDTLSTTADNLKVSVATACRNIAMAGQKTVQWDGSDTPTDDQVTDACTQAQAVISGVFTASASLEIDGSFSCQADVSAQADCTANCSGEASCKGGDVTAECDPGSLSVTCSGMCKANATCDANGTAIQCNGACTGGFEGTCTGMCQGSCDGKATSGGSSGASCAGMCKGSCTASASGMCSGSCKLSADASCSGSAKCTGGCSVMGTDPVCKGSVTPPSCNASAQCKGSCQAKAQASASCTTPQVHVVGSAASSDVITVVETELPKLLVVVEAQGKNLVTVIGNVTGGIQSAVSGSAACLAQLKTFGEASASINVSVTASASASGSATGGSLSPMTPRPLSGARDRTEGRARALAAPPGFPLLVRSRCWHGR